MQNYEAKGCNDLLPYLTGEGTEFERVAFEKHLRTCASCREEWQQLQSVWDALPSQLELLEPPKDLRAQVMESIDNLEPEVKKQRPSVEQRSGPSKNNRLR